MHLCSWKTSATTRSFANTYSKPLTFKGSCRSKCFNYWRFKKKILSALLTNGNEWALIGLLWSEFFCLITQDHRKQDLPFVMPIRRQAAQLNQEVALVPPNGLRFTACIWLGQLCPQPATSVEALLDRRSSCHVFWSSKQTRSQRTTEPQCQLC